MGKFTEARWAILIALMAALTSGFVLLLLPKSPSPATVNGTLRITLDEPIRVQRGSERLVPSPVPTATLYAPTN